MVRKDWYLLILVSATVLGSCGGKTSAPEEDAAPVDSSLLIVESDTLPEEPKEVMPVKADGTFDDFLFNFVRSARLQRERVRFPLPVVMEDSTRHMMSEEDWTDEFYFLSDTEFYTILWNSEQQIEEQKKDTAENTVSVEQILLVSQEVRRYDFQRKQGKWMLVRLRHLPFEADPAGDFLKFYSRFASDSLYREAHIAPYVAVSLLDPSDDMQHIEGSIEREQFPIFCPEVPSVSISNILYGQPYDNPSRMILQKTGYGNEMQELFTFAKQGRDWHLVKYEN